MPSSWLRKVLSFLVMNDLNRSRNESCRSVNVIQNCLVHYEFIALLRDNDLDYDFDMSFYGGLLCVKLEILNEIRIIYGSLVII